MSRRGFGDGVILEAILEEGAALVEVSEAAGELRLEARVVVGTHLVDRHEDNQGWSADNDRFLARSAERSNGNQARGSQETADHGGSPQERSRREGAPTMDSGTLPRQRVSPVATPPAVSQVLHTVAVSLVLPWVPVNSSNRSIPVWNNILLRTTLYYLALMVALYGLNSASVGCVGLILSDTGFESIVAGAAKSAVMRSYTSDGPAALTTLVAMASAFLFALPVAWIYILTRQKKGYSQSVVQSLLVLPIVIAGIVVLVKHSLPLAFSLAGIVAAVRFRTNLDDTKDAAAIFCVTGIGLAAAVQPGVAAVLSVGFNALAVGLWATEFGRSQASLEGKRAQRQLDRALTVASRTGTFVAKMDDEVLKSLAPEQLEALADRAWKRKKKMVSDEVEEP